MSQRGPFNFLTFCNKKDVRRVPNGPPFTFYGTLRLFKCLIFCLILGFFNKYPPIIFSILSKFWRWRFENLALYPNCWRYIRTILRLTKEARNFENKRTHLSQHAISNFGRYIRSNLCYIEEDPYDQKSASICFSTLYPNFWRVFRALKAPFGSFKKFSSVLWAYF